MTNTPIGENHFVSCFGKDWENIDNGILSLTQSSSSGFYRLTEEGLFFFTPRRELFALMRPGQGQLPVSVRHSRHRPYLDFGALIIADAQRLGTLFTDQAEMDAFAEKTERMVASIKEGRETA